MATLDEILEKADLNDDTAFEFGGSKFTVGDLRKLRKSLNTETAAAKTKREEAERLAGEAATLLAKLQEADKTREKVEKKVEEKAGEDWRKDPFYAPVAAALDAMEASNKLLRDELTKTRKDLDQASTIYAYERLRNQYNTLPESVRKANAFETLAQQAIKEGHKDSFQMPTLDPIITRLTEPDRIHAAVAAEREKWDKEQRERDAAAAAGGRPGGGARFRNVKGDAKPPIAKIEDLNSEAIQKAMADDPEFRKTMEEGTVQ